jgi:hypothetical protein
VVRQEGRWHAYTYEGFRPGACDLVGFFRPRLSGCVGKHHKSGADKALPAIVLAVVAAVGTVGKVCLPLLRLILRADPGDRSEADLQRRVLTQAGAALQPDEVLVVNAGFGVGTLLTESVTRFVARVARNFTARRMCCRSTKAGDDTQPMEKSGSVLYPAPTKARRLPPRLRMPLRSGWWLDGLSTRRSGTTWSSPRLSRAPRRFGVR